MSMATNLAGWWLTLRGIFPYGHMILNRVVLVDHETARKMFIPTFAKFKAAKSGKVFT